MNPYIHFDRAEDVRQRSLEYQESRDALIRDKADELAEKWPQELSQFADKNLGLGSIIYTDFAQDAYAKMVDEICLWKANMQFKGLDI